MAGRLHIYYSQNKTFFAQLFNEITQNQAIFESAKFFGLAQNFEL
jgi:hypothetical protein